MFGKRHTSLMRYSTLVTLVIFFCSCLQLGRVFAVVNALPDIQEIQEVPDIQVFDTASIPDIANNEIVL